MSEHECVCGFESDSPQGISAHQRHCEEYESDDSSDSGYSTTTVSTAVADAVFERDDGQCVRCESTDGLTIHRYDEDGPEDPRNLVLLCADCDALIEGGHPLSKRTQVGR